MMMRTRSKALRAMVILFAFCAAAATAGAQTAASAEQEMPLMPYVDRTLGFEIQVPANWRYDRTGFFGPGGSAGLLRGAAPDGRATMQILAFLDISTPGFASWIEYFSQRLGTIDGTRSVRVKGIDDSERPSAFVVADAQIGIDHTQSYYYCVAFDSQTVFVLTCASVQEKSLGKGDAGAPPEEIEIPIAVQQIADSLRVLYDPQLAREMAAALERGREFLATNQLEARIRTLRIDESIRFFEMFVEGRPVGFVTRQFTREMEPLQQPDILSNAKDGVRVRERSYRFGDDGAAQFDKIDLFSSRDGQTDVYEFSHAVIPPTNAKGTRPVLTRDQCVREGETLFSTRLTSEDVGLPEPRRPLKLDASFLGLAWSRLLPALLGPDAQPMIAFTVYDPETRTLLTHGVTPQGAAKTTDEGEPLFAYETRMGFDEHPWTVLTDRHGNVMRRKSGVIELRPSSSAAIEQKYGAQRDAANERMTRRQ